MVFRNVHLTAGPRSGSILNGNRNKQGISDVFFEGLLIAGRTIISAGQVHIRTSEVRSLEFRIEP